MSSYTRYKAFYPATQSLSINNYVPKEIVREETFDTIEKLKEWLETCNEEQISVYKVTFERMELKKNSIYKEIIQGYELDV